MTSQELRQMMLPYVRKEYPAAQARKSLLFVGMEGIEALAEYCQCSLRDAMILLLRQNIWPERFRRNYPLFSSLAMTQLLQSRILIVGCGGLGGHLVALLARSGIGTFRLCDFDVFDESNLNRQYFSLSSTLGQQKATVACKVLRDMAPHVTSEAILHRANAETLPAMLQDVDMVIDCLDSVPDKLLLEEHALRAAIPFVHGSVLHDEGFAFLSLTTPRLAALYPQGLSTAEVQAGHREPMSCVAATGVACIMAQLCLRFFAARAEHGQPQESPLIHLDYSVPELESFA